MKRKICVVLAVLTILCVVHPGVHKAAAYVAEEWEIAVASNSYALEVTEPTLTQSRESGTFTAAVSFGEDAEGRQIRIAVAFYTQDGKMTGCWSGIHTLTTGEELSLSGALPEYDRVGVYFFEADSLTPVRPRILRLLEDQVTGESARELREWVETRLAQQDDAIEAIKLELDERFNELPLDQLEQQEASVSALQAELDDLVNSLMGEHCLSDTQGNRTVTDAGTGTRSRSVRSTIIGWSTYMTKDIMFGEHDEIEGMILYDCNIEAVEGVDRVDVEIQLRNFDDSNETNLVAASTLVATYTAEVAPNGVDDYYLVVPIAKSDLEHLNEEFLLGFRTVHDGTRVRMEMPTNSSCVVKDKNDTKLAEKEQVYKYVGYYTGKNPAVSYSTCSPDIFFSAELDVDVSSFVDDTLSEPGRAADSAAVGAALESMASTRDEVSLELPEYYDLVVGDTFELFYKGIANCVDYSFYEFDLSFSSGKNLGNAYARKYVFTPDESHVGTHTLTVTLRNNSGAVLDRQQVELRVHPIPVAPAEETVVLCMGDSLTAGGVWPAELRRRLAGQGGTPAGWELENLQFIGTKEKDGTNYEGVGGWTFASYLGEKSPFYQTETGEIDFSAYAAQQGVEKIDHALILLGWNNTNTGKEAYLNNARALLDSLFAAFPDCEVTLLGLQVPSRDGFGENYGLSWKYYDKLQHVWNIQDWYQQLCEESAYQGKVTYVNVAGQFDTEYNMPQREVAVNVRSEQKEVVQVNGVHPAQTGYYQIADAAVRHLAAKLNG